MYIDTHTHFKMVMNRLQCNESAVIDNLKNNGIKYAVQVATSCETLNWSYDFTKRNREKGIFFTLGIQPSFQSGPNELESLEKILKKVMEEEPDLLLGIGECGLDYYRMKQKKETQIKSFIFQINLAKAYDIPLIIHIRDAMPDALKILKSRAPVRGIMHCFPGDRHDAKRALDLGFYISFAGNLTYKNASILHDTAKYVPIDHIFLETDAPYLTPVPFRGKNNRSEYVIYTYKYMAELKKISCDVLQNKVYENFRKILKKNRIKK